MKAHERAYNTRSTRALWHWWKPPVPGLPVRTALCGAEASDEVLDGNVGHLRGCGRCDAIQRKESEAEKRPDVCRTCKGVTGFVNRRGTLDVCDDPWHDDAETASHIEENKS